jgi:hypothetical protein
MSIRQPKSLEAPMIRSRSALSCSFVTAAALTLLALPDLSAQSTTPSPTARPAAGSAAEADLLPDDATHLRSFVSEEATHRDRIARLERLRAIASQRGQAERLADLDRLDRVERQRHEARRLATHSRLSPDVQRQADDFARRGGTFKMRRRGNVAGIDGVERHPARAGNERTLPQRKATTTRSGSSRQTGSRPSSRSGSTSRGGSRSGGSSRGPR